MTATVPLRVVVCDSSARLARYAAAEVAARLNQALAGGERARMLLSTGQSQLETLASLVRLAVDWERVDTFHLDEYVGLPADHPASFRRYLRERVENIVPVRMNYIEPESTEALQTLGDDVASAPMDVALVGVGENGHLAFNDPPADLTSQEVYMEVQLDARCRQQQVGEGWFGDITQVPERAVTMSVDRILRSKAILSAVPYKAKAEIVSRLLLSAKVDPYLPATALMEHQDVVIALDRDSAALLPRSLWNQCVVLTG